MVGMLCIPFNEIQRNDFDAEFQKSIDLKIVGCIIYIREIIT